MLDIPDALDREAEKAMRGDLIEQAEALCESLPKEDVEYDLKQVRVISGKTDDVLKHIDAIMKMADMFPQLFAEIKRIREEVVSEEIRSENWRDVANERGGQLQILRIELTKWRETAIEAKAVSYFVNLHSKEMMFDMQPTEIQNLYRERAAKELDLQIRHDARDISPQDCCP
jgi:hypothetical protein